MYKESTWCDVWTFYYRSDRFITTLRSLYIDGKSVLFFAMHSAQKMEKCEQNLLQKVIYNDNSIEIFQPEEPNFNNWESFLCQITHVKTTTTMKKIPLSRKSGCLAKHIFSPGHWNIVCCKETYFQHQYCFSSKIWQLIHKSG